MYFILLPYFFLNLSDLGADVELLWPFRISICYCVFSTAFNGGRLTCSTTAKAGQVSPPPPPQDSISEFIPVFDSMYSKQFCPFRDFSISPNTEKL